VVALTLSLTHHGKTVDLANDLESLILMQLEDEISTSHNIMFLFTNTSINYGDHNQN